MVMKQHFSLHRATHAEIPEVLDFVMQARAELFPKLSASGLPADLAQFAATYMEGEGRFLLARHNGQLIGAVGYLPYDHRFAQLDRDHDAPQIVQLPDDSGRFHLGRPPTD